MTDAMCRTRRFAALAGVWLALGLPAAAPAPAQEARERVFPARPAPATPGTDGGIAGVVVYADPETGVFVDTGEDTTLVESPPDTGLVPGDRVEIAGTIAEVDGRRVVRAASVTRRGSAALPPARAAAAALLLTDPDPRDWVEITAVVERVVATPSGAELEVASAELPLPIAVTVAAPVPSPSALIDAEIRIRGVRRPIRTPQGVVMGVRMLSPGLGPGDVLVPPGDPRDLPTLTAAEIRRAAFAGQVRHRVGQHGTVILIHPSLTPGRALLHVQDATGAVPIEVDRDAAALTRGDVVEVVGFPAQVFGVPMLRNGTVHRRGRGELPAAPDTTLPELTASSYQGSLVRLRVTFDSSAPGPESRMLLASSGGTPVTVYAYEWPAGAPLPDIKPGSVLDLTGVAAVLLDAAGALQGVVFIVPGEEAIDVVAVPSWWTPLRLGLAAGGAAGACLLALLWVGVLNVRVRQQTRALTDQFEATAALQRRWTDLVSSASDVILTWNLDGRLTSINSTGQALTGLSEEAALCLTLEELAAPGGVPVARTLMARIDAASPAGTYEMEILGEGGRVVPLELNVQPMFENRWHTGFLAIGRDMTTHKAAERALREARDAAEDANRAKSEFLANMSHEIRTPMNGIIGMTELAMMTELDSQQREYLDTVKSSADALLGLLNSILDFSKIESRKLDMESVPFELRDLIAGTMKPLGVAAEARGLELLLDIAPHVPDALIGDPLRLRQVVTNLVGNAIKFTDTGHVLVEIDAEAAGSHRTCLQIAVTDTGVGIPADKWTSIFEPFSQADGSTTRRYGGTGLGLAISASLVSLLGGRIWVESAPGQGSTFRFTAQFDIVSEAEAAASGPLLARVPVLIVDDNAVNRRILSEQLGRYGMTTRQAESATIAMHELTAAASRGEAFQLVLLDVHMPGHDGFWVAEQIGIDPALAGTTVIMLTSAGQPPDAERCRQLRVSAYMSKPISPTHLMEVISRVTGQHLPGPEAPPPAPPEVGGQPERRRVLLAEDNLVNQRVAVGLLTRRGHDVVVASNGREALEALAREPFDVVLMDVQMPELGGLDATLVIRQEELGTGRHVRIVALTAHTMSGDHEECLAAGMDDYLSKPVSPDALYAAVEGPFAGPDGLRRASAA